MRVKYLGKIKFMVGGIACMPGCEHEIDKKWVDRTPKLFKEIKDGGSQKEKDDAGEKEEEGSKEEIDNKEKVDELHKLEDIKKAADKAGKK